jgi:hypothetical protein
MKKWKAKVANLRHILRNNMTLKYEPISLQSALFDPPKTPKPRTFTQYSTDGLNYRFIGKTVTSLEPGYYEPRYSDSGAFLQKIDHGSDELFRFKDSYTDLITAEIEKFWNLQDKFQKYKLSYKRGILLYGPPGNGKTSVTSMVCENLINRKGVIFKYGDPSLFNECFRNFRQIEPETPTVVIMEDIDGLLKDYHKQTILNTLDGIEGMHKVVFIATTNYPELLDKNIKNRPSRFDRRIRIGNPVQAIRDQYLRFLYREEVPENIADIVKDTQGFSLSHIKELFVSTHILGNNYDEALEDLKGMSTDISSDEDNRKKVGFV